LKHLEIERKFLVKPGVWEQTKKPLGKKLFQGYLCNDDKKSIRVRITADKASLTVKGALENLCRPEFEYVIHEGEASDLLIFAQNHCIEKTRYKTEYKGKIWDVDVFHGLNAGLFLAEIELNHPDELVELPGWVGEEVSCDPRYYNSYLSEHPFTTWK